MSSVALQFMIYVLNSTELCDDAPNVLNLMNDNGTVASIALNSSFFQTIIADSGSTSVRYCMSKSKQNTHNQLFVSSFVHISSSFPLTIAI